MVVMRLLICTLAMSGATVVSWWMATSGALLSDDLSQTASVRTGSVGGSRVLVGGGIQSGK